MLAGYPILLAALALPAPFPVAEVRRGMRGECRTVYEGHTIEAIGFEVKGVMRDYLGPGRDVVLTRLLGDKASFSGVVAGMSGSPCSIDGRLLGALAYAFAAFAKEPIAGITPIGGMLEIMRLPAEERPARLAHGLDAAGWEALRRGAAPTPGPAPEHGLRPIATPLALGGVPPGVRRHFAPYLRAAGFEPVAGGGGGAAAAPVGTDGAALTPGGTVAAVLVRGDVDIAATGTVTWVDGRTVLAFGHPFFGAGAVSLPMASAEILNTMVSSQRSFKMAATGPLVGELTQDRLTAIGGVLGPPPAMVPVAGTLTTPRGAAHFHLELARDPQLTPQLLAMAVASALAGRVDASERGTVRLDAELRMGCLPPLRVRGAFAAQRDEELMAHAAIELAQHFAALWNTPFSPPPAAAVRVHVDYVAEPIAEQVMALAVDRTHARVGERLAVAVQLRRDNGPASTERFEVPVPRAWAGQEVTVWAGGHRAAEQRLRRQDGPPQPQSDREIAAWLTRRRGDGQLYLLVTRAGSGLHAAARPLPFLPPSAVALLGDAPLRRALEEGVAYEDARPRPGTLDGQAMAAVQVLPQAMEATRDAN